jgi:hypothetical protein
MPKAALKIERFEGGINNHFHKKDIPENSFEVADNAMFDTLGKVRPGGYTQNLDDDIEETIIDASSGYGLFSFSHDFSNPDTSTDLSPQSNTAGSSGERGFFNETDGTELTHTADTDAKKVILTDSTVATETPWNLWNTTPSSNSGEGAENKGWRYDGTNRLIFTTDGDSQTNYAVTPVAKENRAYFISVIADGNTDEAAESDTTPFGGGGTLHIFAHKGMSITNGSNITSVTPSTTGISDIFIIGNNTNGNLGVKASSTFQGRVHRIIIKEVPCPRDVSYILTQNNRHINLLDTSLKSFRTNLLPLHDSSLTNVKSQYYIGDGDLRVFNANFDETCENKWFGFISRKNFLDTSVSSVDGSVTTSSSSGAFIRQWVEEDQQIYKPPSVASAESHTGDGDGKPGKVSYQDYGDNGTVTDGTEASDGIKIHIARDEVTDGTCDGSYTFFLSYLYDDSEQESSLTEIGTDTGSSGDAYFIGVTVDYSNSNGYAFNKRITGARLYYSDSTDSEGFKYHLLDIDFVQGCRKFDDVDFIKWATEGATAVECPPNLVGGTVTDTEKFFQFKQMPKVTF